MRVSLVTSIQCTFFNKSLFLFFWLFFHIKSKEKLNKESKILFTKQHQVGQ